MNLYGYDSFDVTPVVKRHNARVHSMTHGKNPFKMQFYFVLAANVMNSQEQQCNSRNSEEFSHEKTCKAVCDTDDAKG